MKKKKPVPDTMRAIIEMVPEGKYITTREVAYKFHLRRETASDKVRQLVNRGFFEPEGMNQFRRYRRTKKSIDEFGGITLDSESFAWFRDPADFPLRANP